MKITMWKNANTNLSLLSCKHSLKMSQICIISKWMAFLKCHLMVISLQPLLAFKILARNYYSPRTVSVKVKVCLRLSNQSYMYVPLKALIHVACNQQWQKVLLLIRSRYPTWLSWTMILFCKHVVFVQTIHCQ